MTGISNFKWYLKDKYQDEVYERWRDRIKKKSIEENRGFTYPEITEIPKIED